MTNKYAKKYMNALADCKIVFSMDKVCITIYIEIYGGQFLKSVLFGAGGLES